MKEDQVQQDLASIRSMMERSSKFLSLSGLSGILAGIYALVGAALAYQIIYNSADAYEPSRYSLNFSQPGKLIELILIALAVLVASVITGFVLSSRKAKKSGQSIWGGSSRALLFNMAVPLFTGGLLMIVFLTRGYFGIIGPASLIFYGLALIGASNFTFTDVKYLGLSEIVLGLVAAIYPGYGLQFWAVGFGLLHIIYGSIMYSKYDR